jgi:hypothetical protein
LSEIPVEESMRHNLLQKAIAKLVAAAISWLLRWEIETSAGLQTPLTPAEIGKYFTDELARISAGYSAGRFEDLKPYVTDEQIARERELGRREVPSPTSIASAYGRNHPFLNMPVVATGTDTDHKFIAVGHLAVRSAGADTVEDAQDQAEKIASETRKPAVIYRAIRKVEPKCEIVSSDLPE